MNKLAFNDFLDFFLTVRAFYPSNLTDFFTTSLEPKEIRSVGISGNFISRYISFNIFIFSKSVKTSVMAYIEKFRFLYLVIMVEMFCFLQMKA
jgi:hypothetical protein